MIVAISDVHIGSVFAKQELFFKFLESLPETTTLILLGDIVDTWKDMPKENFYKAFLKFPAIFYFPGNHDREILISQILSPTVQKERIIPVNKLQVIFTHGDIFDSTAGIESIFNRVVEAFFYWLSKIIKIDIRTRLEALTNFFYQNLTNFYKKVVCYMLDKQVDVIVYGHTHCPGKQIIQNKTLFNLGCWYGKPYAFFLKGDKYAFFEITEDKLLPEEKDFNDLRGH